LSVRWAWLWLGLLWLLGLCTGGLHPLALPLLPLAWVIYAAGVASIGVWFSIVSRTTMRAMLWSLLTTIGVAAGHWLVTGICCYMPLAALANVRNRELEIFLKIQAGQTVPFVLAWFGFRGDEFDHMMNNKEPIELTIFSFLGLACWAGGAWWVWRAAANRFRRVTGRVPLRPGPLRAPAVAGKEHVAVRRS
jgi:hypothetical protein